MALDCTRFSFDPLCGVISTGSGNDSLPVKLQAIPWTSADLLSQWSLKNKL